MCARVLTDTATIVIFDSTRLASRRNDECDWWTGQGDLEHEEAQENLAFVETGKDGVFNVEVIVDTTAPADSVLKRSFLELPSGELLFGGGECLPGEGVLRSRNVQSLGVPAGRYTVVVVRTDCSNERYCFYLSPTMAKP